MEERLARKRKVGTVVPPVLQNGGLTRKTPRTTCNRDAATPGLPVKRSEPGHAQWSVEQVMAHLSSRGFDKTVCAAFEGEYNPPSTCGSAPHVLVKILLPTSLLSSLSFFCSHSLFFFLSAHQIEGSHLASLTEETFDKMNIK